MTMQEQGEESPLQTLLYRELLDRIAQVSAAPDPATAVELLRPAGFRAIHSRAMSRIASELAGMLSAVWQEGFRESGAGRRQFTALAPAVPTAAELSRELGEVSAPFFQALAVLQVEHNSYVEMSAGSSKKAVSDHSGFGTIGAAVGSLLGPVGAIVGGALGGYLGGVQLDEQLGQQGQRLDEAFEHLLNAYDQSAQQAVGHLERRVERFSVEVGHALEDTRRRLAEPPPAEAALLLPPAGQQESARNVEPTRSRSRLLVAGAAAVTLTLVAVATMISAGGSARGTLQGPVMVAAMTPRSAASAGRPGTATPGDEGLPDRPTNGTVVRVVGGELDALRACGAPTRGPIAVVMRVRRDGSVASVTVGAPYARTPVAACFSAVLSDAHFPPFRSEMSEVMFRLARAPGGDGVVVVPGSAG